LEKTVNPFADIYNTLFDDVCQRFLSLIHPQFLKDTESSENQLNPIIIRIRKPYKNENAPYLSFP